MSLIADLPDFCRSLDLGLVMLLGGLYVLFLFSVAYLILDFFTFIQFFVILYGNLSLTTEQKGNQLL